MTRKRTIPILIVGTAVIVCAVTALHYTRRRSVFMPVAPTTPLMAPERLSSFQRALLQDLDRQVRANIRYQDGYFQGGDPPPNVGVCTDVVIRSFRAAGIDLHRQVAEDIRRHSREYGIARPDPNIDHRRCRNLSRFFRRYALSLPVSGPQADWQPGDIVFWDTARNGKCDHVGMIANGRDEEGNPTVIQHWGGLHVAQTDGLFHFPIRYHFRWSAGPDANTAATRAAHL